MDQCITFDFIVLISKRANLRDTFGLRYLKGKRMKAYLLGFNFFLTASNDN